MPDDRQAQIDQVLTTLRGMYGLGLPLALLQQTAVQLIYQYALTPAEQAAINQALGGVTIFEDANVAQGNIVAGDMNQKIQSVGNDFADATIERMNDAVAGHKIGQQTNIAQQIIHHTPQTPAIEPLMQTYLANLASVVSRVPLPDADTADPNQREVLLDAIYTRLEVVSSVGRELPAADYQDSELRGETLRQLSAFEALQRHQYMVLLGAPGSGKSTVVNGLVWALTQACQQKINGSDFLAREGWQDATLTPILVNLSRWSAWMKQAAPEMHPLAVFWDYLASQYAQPVVDELMQRTGRGTTIIICDGLDEVPLAAHGSLPRLKQALYALAETGVKHLVVTCRVLDYERPERQLVPWPTETLLPFSDALQQAFIARWYATLGRLGRALLDTPDVLRPRLQTAVRSRTDLRRIAGNPLLLTMMALLHASQGELPDKRIKLYSECVDLLLRRWRRFRHGTKDIPSLEEHLRAGDVARDDVHEWSKDDTEALLDRLAFVAHSQVHTDASGAGTNIAEAVLMQEITTIFKRYGFSTPAARAEAFCAYIDTNDNGILQRHEQDVFRFPHRTFQEFLAARYLVGDRGWATEDRDLVTRLLNRCDRPEWREVLQLAVSKLVNDGRERDVTILIDKLLTRNKAGSRAWAQHVTIAAELLVEVPRQKLQELGKDEAKLWERLRDDLWRALDPKQRQTGEDKRVRQPSELLDAAGRVRAGTALGYLIVPDLRTKITPDWRVVPAGTYPIGEVWEQQTVTLEGFRISRYPVTNALYRQFIHDHGYDNHMWWSDHSWQERERRNWTVPRFWNDARFNGDLQPVVGISWYEARAFCAWLSHYLGYLIQLPTDAQWEAAARGSHGLFYPWGNTWQDGRANVNQQFGCTTPVVCFASGASWCGALDMAGNVREWTASEWNNADRTNRIDTIENGAAVSIRGGSWFNLPQLVRAAYRVRNNLLDGDYFLGVRLVCALK